MSIVPLSGAAIAAPSKGEISLGAWQRIDSKVKIDEMTLRYEFSQYFQEPMERYSFKYEVSDQTSRVLTIKIRAQVWLGSMAQDAYVVIDPQTGQPGEWAWDMAGSPDWGKTFTSDNGKFVSAEATQSYFSQGFTLKLVEIIDISVNTATDEAYESLVSGMGASEAIGEGSPTSFDGMLPKSFSWTGAGSAATAFWKERGVFGNISNGSLNTENDGGGLRTNTYAETVNWTYGDYVHEAASFVVQGSVTQKKDIEIEPPILTVTVRWTDSLGNIVSTSRYSHVVSGGERIVIAERQRKSADGGYLSASYSIHYQLRKKKKKKKDEKDPLADDLLAQQAMEALDEIEQRRFAEQMAELEDSEERAFEVQAEADDYAEELQDAEDAADRSAWWGNLLEDLTDPFEDAAEGIAGWFEDEDQEIAPQPVYEAPPPPAEKWTGYYAAEDSNGSWGFKDPSGQWAIYPQYAAAREFSEGAAWVQSKGDDNSTNWNLIGPDNITKLYNRKPLSNMRNGIVVAKDGDGKCNFFDKNGNPGAASFGYSDFDECRIKDNGLYVGRTGAKESSGLFDRSNKYFEVWDEFGKNLLSDGDFYKLEVGAEEILGYLYVSSGKSGTDCVDSATWDNIRIYHYNLSGGYQYTEDSTDHHFSFNFCLTAN